MKHDQYFISACLFLASFVLQAFMEMFTFPVSQLELMDWISWILGVGAVIIFFSGLISHKHR